MEENEMNKRYKVFIVTESGKILGKPDYTRWNKCKWWQKIIGNIFKRYKNRFVDVVGFDCDLGKKYFSS